jgi:hypothetical protein
MGIRAFTPKVNDEIKERPSAPKGKQSRVLNVKGIVLSETTISDEFFVSGSIIPDEEVDLSFETSGKVTDIFFKEGSKVSKGDLLAKINDAPLQAERKKLEAQLKLFTDRMYRQNALLEKEAVSQEAFQEAETNLATLQAEIDKVVANIEQTELRARLGCLNKDVLGRYRRRDDENRKLFSRTLVVAYVAEHADAVHLGQPDIHYNYVGTTASDLEERLLAVGCFLNASVSVAQKTVTEHRASGGIFVDDQNFGFVIHGKISSDLQFLYLQEYFTILWKKLQVFFSEIIPKKWELKMVIITNMTKACLFCGMLAGLLEEICQIHLVSSVGIFGKADRADERFIVAGSIKKRTMHTAQINKIKGCAPHHEHWFEFVGVRDPTEGANAAALGVHRKLADAAELTVDEGFICHQRSLVSHAATGTEQLLFVFILNR